MKLKVITGIVLTLFLVGMLTLAFDIQPVKASGTIYIRADGSIDGPANITTVDYVTYYFNESNYDEIVVERNNIVVDGAGYTLQGTGSGEGISLTERSNVTIKYMEIKAFGRGIRLYSSSNNTISGNNITNNGYYGIILEGGSNNVISGNNITANRWAGIWLSSSSNNTISGNNITANRWYGVQFWHSSNNVLRSNSMANNMYNLVVWGVILSHFVNDIDVSNIVDDKPIYYWINERDRGVPLDAGYVALVNCTCIIVQNLNLTSNGQGILLAFTTNSTTTKNNIANNQVGIMISSSSNNSISGNNIANNSEGISLAESSYNSISGNNITNNDYHGVYLYLSSNNTIYHNNFINNTNQVYSYDGLVNVWDDGYPSGGNYWSDYEDRYPDAKEIDGSGIWDTPYVIDENNQDNYPIVPEFPTWTSMLLVITGLTVAIAIYKRRLVWKELK